MRALVLLLSALPCLAQPALPRPSGPHSIGRTTLRWANANGGEFLMHVWYPAQRPGRTPAPYLPGAERLNSSPASGSLQNVFGSSWPSIVANTLRTHSYEEEPVLTGSLLPVLIFSPGGGVPVFSYTTQMEDLASHGYVVAGVEPGDAPERRVREIRDPEKREKALTDLLAIDLRPVLDQLEMMQNDPKSMFASRLDLRRIGAFGHSRGGRTAARLCQSDPRVKACLNEDGNWSWHPFWLDDQGRSLQQPFLMLDHLDPELPDEVFAKIGTTREEYARRRSARQAEAREKIYTRVAGGSYHLTIRTPGVSHNSFADMRHLGRADSGNINGWPPEVQAATPHAHLLHLVNTVTRAFFDQHVRGVPGALLDATKRLNSEIEVRKYGVRAE